MTRNTSFIARPDAVTTPNTPSLHGASIGPTQYARITPPPNPSLIRAIVEVEQKLKDMEEKYKESEEKAKAAEEKLKEIKKKSATRKKELRQAKKNAEYWRDLAKMMLAER
jgi:hypothetical protein